MVLRCASSAWDADAAMRRRTFCSDVDAESFVVRCVWMLQRCVVAHCLDAVATMCFRTWCLDVVATMRRCPLRLDLGATRHCAFCLGATASLLRSQHRPALPEGDLPPVRQDVPSGCWSACSPQHWFAAGGSSRVRFTRMHTSSFAHVRSERGF